MNIYALDFRLELRLDLPSPHFSWQRIPLGDVAAQLTGSGIDFPEQMFYAEASMDSLDLVRQLLENKEVAAQQATLVLLFKEEAEKEHFFEALRDGYRPEVAAGGLVFNAQQELLLIERLGRWDLPKGKLEANESIEEAAWREVEEETHLQGHQTTSHFADTYHVFNRKGKWTFKVTHWYLMAVDQPQDLKPQTEEGITAVKWWSKEALASELPRTYPLIEDLINRVRETTH